MSEKSRVDKGRNVRTISRLQPLRSGLSTSYSAAPAKRGERVGRSSAEQLEDARKREARPVGEVDESSTRSAGLPKGPSGPFGASGLGRFVSVSTTRDRRQRGRR